MTYKNIRQLLIDKFYMLLTIISPKLNTKVHYKRVFGKRLDLNNPTTLNEKILWLKLNTYYKNPLVTQCADKYAVRRYVTRCGCPEILNEIYGVYESVEEINWNHLPRQFVIKSNYGWGHNIVCRDKKVLNIDKEKRRIEKWGKSHFHLLYSEMQYADIKRNIIVERLLGNAQGQLDDYKLYCFSGKPLYAMVCVGRGQGHPKFYYVDKDGQLMREMSRDGLETAEGFMYEKPKGWHLLFHYAEILSKPFPFVRTDFYLVDENVYFGELTFTPSAGLDDTRLAHTDLVLGKEVDLSMQQLPWRRRLT